MYFAEDSLDSKRFEFMNILTADQVAAVLAFLDYCADNPGTLDSGFAAKHALAI